MTPDHPEAGVLLDALREDRRDQGVLQRFGVAWADDLGVDEIGLWASVAGLRMRWIRSGRFVMGSPEDEEGRFANEPQRTVEIARGFWLGETPVTQREWLRFSVSNSSRFTGEECPVENVSWRDCQDFLRRLPPGLPWRLPTEAEWEYACRAGTTTARYGNVNEIAWHQLNAMRGTQAVETLRPNDWGLHDMLGNVWEWCQDSSPSAWQLGAGRGARIQGLRRVVRGGAWNTPAHRARAAARDAYDPSIRGNDVGLRLAA